MRIFVCVVLITTMLRSDASLAIIAPSFIDTGKQAILLAYVFKGEMKQKVAQWTLPPDRTFSMSFFHSVTHTPVSSTYVAEEAGIIQIQERFTTHGYGLPSSNTDIGVESWKEKDEAFILQMNRSVHPFVIRVSKQYKTRLTIGTISYSLQQYDRKSLLLKTAKL